MKNDITSLEPQGLWKNFHALTQIPRPSKHESKALDFVAAFGESLNLETLRDDIGNVVIRKPATKGMENKKGVILQAHIDMVPQKNANKNHNFETDPIETIIEDGWVRANETTLGADNGIGVAAAMAVLADASIEHGALEVLITTDEETGMTGAFNLQPNILKGDILLNLDSEEENELYIGCAGGVDATATFRYSEVETAEDDIAFRIEVSGLKGGHSGLDIALGRANANKLLFRFLKFAAANYEAMLAHVEGGNMRNAIPREAWAVITIDREDKEDFIEAVEEFEDMFRAEFNDTEPTLTFSAKQVDTPTKVIDEMTADDLINAIQGCPNGVMKMSTEVEKLVETSTNLAIVQSKEATITVQFLIRSSIETAKEDTASSIESIFRLAGAEVETSGEYPGWKPNRNSQILDVMTTVQTELFGKSPIIKAIHAGLECGILSGIYPKWDMISFGPTIKYPHSPDERVNIASVERFWQLLKSTLKNIPDRN